MSEHKRWASVVTGSRKYGKPRKESDIDLVVLVSPADLCRLREACESQKNVNGKTTIARVEELRTKEGRELSTESDGAGEMSSGSFRFGMLNLVAVTEPDMFQTWAAGTKQLTKWAKERGPQSRDEATEYLRSLRQAIRKKPAQKTPQTQPRDYHDDIPF